MSAYAMLGQQVLREIDGVLIDGKPLSISQIRAWANGSDRLPDGHVVLEQAECDVGGRVEQTVRGRDGREYKRVVSGEEAYGPEN